MAKAVLRSTAAAPLAAFLCAAAAAGAQPAAVQVSRSGQGAYEASIAPHGDRFAVAWHDNPTASLIPAIRGAGSRFALAWNEDVVEARGDHLGGGRSEVVFALAP